MRTTAAAGDGRRARNRCARHGSVLLSQNGYGNDLDDADDADDAGDDNDDDDNDNNSDNRNNNDNNNNNNDKCRTLITS